MCLSPDFEPCPLVDVCGASGRLADHHPVRTGCPPAVRLAPFATSLVSPSTFFLSAVAGGRWHASCVARLAFCAPLCLATSPITISCSWRCYARANRAGLLLQLGAWLPMMIGAETCKPIWLWCVCAGFGCALQSVLSLALLTTSVRCCTRVVLRRSGKHSMCTCGSCPLEPCNREKGRRCRAPAAINVERQLHAITALQCAGCCCWTC